MRKLTVLFLILMACGGDNIYECKTPLPPGEYQQIIELTSHGCKNLQYNLQYKEKIIVSVVSLSPHNKLLPCGSHHIIAHSRDYFRDCDVITITYADTTESAITGYGTVDLLCIDGTKCQDVFRITAYPLAYE